MTNFKQSHMCNNSQGFLFDSRDHILSSRLRLAYLAAVSGSPDLSTQNGAAVFDSRGLRIGVSANSFPAGVGCLPERLVRPAKYSFIEHAERGALFDAVRRGYGDRLAGSTMFALWAACPDCARAIIGLGVSRLVTHSYYQVLPSDGEGRKDWVSGVSEGEVMMREAGVEIVYTDVAVAKPRDPSILFNGSLVRF